MAVRWRAPLIYLAAAIVWLRPIVASPGHIPFWPGGEFSDLLIAHIPNVLYARQSLLEWRQLPLWNPLILSGAPFAADPLSGVWYLPNWLAVVLPPVVGFNLVFLLHLAGAGWGGWMLARQEGAEGPGAWLTGLAFSGAPKLLGHVGLGHVGLVSAVCWTPWVLVAAGRAGRALAEGARDRYRWLAGAGALVGVVFLVDPRWALPCGLLAAVYALRATSHSHKGQAGLLRNLFAGGTLALACAVLVAGGLGIPLLEYLPLTTRAALTPGEAASMSLPALSLLGVLLAPQGAWPEWLTYSGLAVAWLAAASALRKRPGYAFWLAVVVLSWALSLGSTTPFYPAVTRILPGGDFLRVPARMLFLSSLALAVMAGKGLEGLYIADRLRVRWVRLGAIAFATLSAGLAVGTLLTKSGNPLSSAWVLGLSVAILILTFLALRSATARVSGGVWLAIIALDLAWVGGSVLEVRPWPGLTSSVQEFVSVAGDLAAGGRAFSPSYSLPQHLAAEQELQLADGINPLQLSAYVDYMSQATGFRSEGYSVTLPPFPSGDPSQDWGVTPDLDKLAALNVRVVATAYPLTANGLALVHETQESFLYRISSARPRAWVQDAPGELSDQSWRPVHRMAWSPHHIVVEADGPGVLVLSEINYPGWRVSIDGGSFRSLPSRELFRSVIIPEGAHRVEFIFRPVSVFLGAASLISGLGLLVLVWRR